MSNIRPGSSRLVRHALAPLAMAAGLALAGVAAAGPASATAVIPQCAFTVDASPATGCGGGGQNPSPPTITQQPADVSAPQGSTITLTATASGDPTPTEQWLYTSDAGATWNPLTGDTGAALVLLADPGLSGDYFEAVFTNSHGSATSAAAQVTVTPDAATAPASAGSPVTYTAGITPMGAPGAVAFLDEGTPISTCTAQPVVSGVATCTVTYSNSGIHVITASYGGAPGFSASSSSPMQEIVQAPAAAPAFGPAAPPAGVVGQAYSYLFPATGSPQPAVSYLSGKVPAGLALWADGTLRGTPTKAGTFTFTMEAYNGVGKVAKQKVTVIVRKAAAAGAASLR
jgi:hypothetical protein